MAQGGLADPEGSGAVISAVRWLQGTLLGTVATVVAVIAVATVGLLMLTGRINWRYGATVILGCFILFGAASIVAGIQSTAQLGQWREWPGARSAVCGANTPADVRRCHL